MSIAGCFFVIQASAKYGLSQLLMTYSLISGNLDAANKAIQVAPGDAEAHFAGGALLSLSGKPEQGAIELEQAVSLRPAYYGMWSELGLLRDQIGDQAGALKAFDEAVRYAPFYAQPRWNRGNVLLRSGQYEAAFNDLTQAAQSNPKLIANLVDLAWGTSRGDVTLTEELAQINNDKTRIAFARLLVRRGLAPEAIAQLRQVRSIPEAIKLELVDQLVSKKAFHEAFEIWSGPLETGKQLTGPAIHEGGFEAPLSFGQGGFGWRVPLKLEATSFVLDSSQPHSGSKDLRIEFAGESNPELALVSQLILVEPSRRYKINFASQSHQVVTGGLPIVIALDTAGAPKRLGQSSALAKDTSSWEFYSFEFTTTPQTSAVTLILTRENCTTSPCPIFGSISLDSFSVELLK